MGSWCIPAMSDFSGSQCLLRKPMPSLMYLTDCYMALFQPPLHSEWVCSSPSPQIHIILLPSSSSLCPLSTSVNRPPSVISGLHLSLSLADYPFLPQIAQSLSSHLSISQPHHFIILLLTERCLVLQWRSWIHLKSEAFPSCASTGSPCLLSIPNLAYHCQPALEFASGNQGEEEKL